MIFHYCDMFSSHYAVYISVYDASLFVHRFLTALVMKSLIPRLRTTLTFSRRSSSQTSIGYVAWMCGLILKLAVSPSLSVHGHGWTLCWLALCFLSLWSFCCFILRLSFTLNLTTLFLFGSCALVTILSTFLACTGYSTNLPALQVMILSQRLHKSCLVLYLSQWLNVESLGTCLLWWERPIFYVSQSCTLFLQLNLYQSLAIFPFCVR